MSPVGDPRGCNPTAWDGVRVCKVCMYEYRFDKVLSPEARADELDLPDEGIFCPVSVKT